MYFVGRNGQQTGPFNVEQLKEMAANGQLNGTDLVWREGMAEWQPASSIAGIFPGSSSAAEAPSGNPAPLVQATVLPPLSGAPVGPRPNGMALTGMILGIVSVTVGLCCCYGFPFNIAGIVFSVIGMNQIKADPVNQTGRQMALAGLWCSIASVVFGILMMVLGVAMNWEGIMKGVNPSP